MKSIPTLELTLQRKVESGYPVVAALTRPGGFLPLRREGMLHLDADLISVLSATQFEPLEYGTALGKALFVDDIRDAFVKALSDEPLRVLLSVEAPDLRALDWHRLAAPFEGRWRLLAVQQNTPFSLAIPSPASAHFPAIGRRDLRALILVAGPESLSGDYNLAPFDVPATIASVKTALADIPCNVIPIPGLDALCATLTATPYTLLHIVCHGAVNERGETILYFPKDDRRAPTPASDLLDRLASLSRLPHFVFISACESALPQNGLGSLAQRLVRELGLPAVLAMTDHVSIVTARAIATPFYAQLHQHGQPDLALAESLAGLQGRHDLTVPILLSRLSGRPLFSDDLERGLTDKELEFGLDKLAESLPERAPVMDSLRDSLTRRLRSTLGADVHSLSDSRRTERTESLSSLNSLSLETLDLSFGALCLGQVPPAYDARSPFRGLESFRPEDAEYFFGREALTRKLVQKLNEHNFLTVLGASGSGKSSLVMAGLIPALNIPYAIFRPGVEPLAELEKALQADPALIVVDQFEELFTLSAREQRSDFISRLLEQSQRIRVVLTLRVDFLGEVAPFKPLNDEVENHQVIIPPMDKAELRRAMEEQAGCVGLRFESDLSQQMLDDVEGEPGAMPLLQHALWTLWTRRHGRWLRADEYRAFGGVKQAIASTAEAVYAGCTEFEQERLRDIFLRLTRLDEGVDGRDTRRRVLLRDLIPADSDPAATTLLVKKLADARLVVVTGDEVEVAHEALIRHWERLRAWLNDDRDNLRLREGVSDGAHHWDNAARDESLLNHRGPRLELALAMSKNPRYSLNPVEQAYLDGCVGLREKEKVVVAKRRWYIIAGVSVALVVIISILAGWGITNNRQIAIAQTAQANAEEQAKIARSGELAAMALFNQDKRLDLSFLLSAKAYEIAGVYQARNALLSNLQLSPNLHRMLYGNSSSINSVAFNPDGSILASGDQNGTIILWDMKIYQPIGEPLREHSAPISSVAFSPNGKILASGGWDGNIILWDMETHRPIGKPIDATYSPLSFPASISSITFSPNGEILVSGSNVGTIILWDVNTHQSIGEPLIGHFLMTIVDVAFSPDGKTLASFGGGTVTLWDMNTLQPIGEPLSGHSVTVGSVAFSPDGRSLVSSGEHGDVILRDVATRKPTEGSFIGHPAPVSSLDFSPDGRILASGSDDRTIILWDVKTQEPLNNPFKGHSAPISSVAFSPDGRILASGGRDGLIILWDVEAPQAIGESTNLHSWGAVDGEKILGFSPDGRFLASCDRNGNFGLWELITHQLIVQFANEQNHCGGDVAFSLNGRVLAFRDGEYINIRDMETHQIVWESVIRSNLMTINPDGRILATRSNDHTITLWNIETHQQIGEPLSGHTSNINGLAFSPEGNILASYAEYTIILWDIKTLLPIGDPFIGRSNWITSIAFSPDGESLASGDVDGSITLWNVKTHQLIGAPIIEQSDSVKSMVFSPDGNILASSNWDGSKKYTINLWDTKTHQLIGEPIESKAGSLNYIVFSSDGKTLVTGDIYDTIVYWDVNPQTWVEINCQRVGRNFTKDEWLLYFQGIDYPIKQEEATCPQWPLRPESTTIPTQ